MEDQPPLDPPVHNLDMTHSVGASVFPLEDLKGMICTDLPGRFTLNSSRGNCYIFVLYDYDSNAILAHPIKSRAKENLIIGYMKHATTS